MFVGPADVVTLNIGGQRFVTSTATLQRGAPDFHASIVSSQRAAADVSSPAEVFIDREPVHFPAVLNYLRSGDCNLLDKISGLLGLRAEAEAYQAGLFTTRMPTPAKAGLSEFIYAAADLGGQTFRHYTGARLAAIDASPSMRVHRWLQDAAQSRELLQTAADALLAYAFGRDDGAAFPGMMADAVSVDMRVALAATAPVQGRYRCRLTASIASPVAAKELRHDYDAAGDIAPPLSTSNIRSAFYSGLAIEQQAVWDEVRFLRKNGDAAALQARQGSCFRVVLRLLPPKALPAAAAAHASGPKPEWRPVSDTTLRFEV